MSDTIGPSGVNESAVSEQIRRLRLQKGMTQEDLAEASGISVGVVRKVEQGGSAVWRPTMPWPGPWVWSR